MIFFIVVYSNLPILKAGPFHLSLNKSLFGFLCLLMFIPLPVSYLLDEHDIRRLNGAYAPPVKPILDYATFMSGEFQQGYEKYFDYINRLHADLVMIKSQFDYSIFNQTSNKKIAIGKDDYMYETDYLLSYTGQDFIGSAKIEERFLKLEYIKKYLEREGKSLLVVITPGKPSFYPDKMPGYYRNFLKQPTNRELHIKELDRYNIPYVDVLNYFLAIKDTAPYPLMPKYGTHWSTYGAVLAMDTIARKIESITKKDIVDMSWDVEEDFKPRLNDYDIGSALNLYSTPPPEKLGYPVLKFDSTDNVKLNTLIISDSFYWQIYTLGIHHHLFHPGSSFWYYFAQTWPESTMEKNVMVKDLTLLDEIKKRDLIIIVSSERNLVNFGFDFIEIFYDELKKNNL